MIRCGTRGKQAEHVAVASYNEFSGELSDEQFAAQARKRFAAAFRPKARIYWLDLLLSALVGWTAFWLSVRYPFGSPASLVTTSIALLALLRAGLFIHEIAHQKRGSLPGFEYAWHALVGLPLLLPSLMYIGSHGDHHRPQTFGTPSDPEYTPLAHATPFGLVRFVLGVCLVPVVLPLRWGVVGPLSFMIPPLRPLVIRRASTLVINLAYRRPPPGRQHRLRWFVQEWAAALVVWLVCISWYTERLSGVWLMQWYVVSAGILVVNQLRTLAAHRYNNTGRQLSVTEQLLDSVNMCGWPGLTVLVAPVGLRYHALHHLLPTVPYHRLGRLHRQLQAECPPAGVYGQTLERGMFSALSSLVGRMGRRRAAQRRARWRRSLNRTGQPKSSG